MSYIYILKTKKERKKEDERFGNLENPTILEFRNPQAFSYIHFLAAVLMAFPLA